MGRRTLLLLAALVVATLGTTGVFLYVNGIDQRAEARYEVVQVLVTQSPIAAGTTAQAAQDAAALELRPFLARSVEGSGALSDISGIAEKVALAPIPVGQPILGAQFGDAGQITNILPIPEGKLAVSIQLDDPARVAGFVGPGSKVAIFITTTETTGPNAGQESTRVLLQLVEVIAAGATTLVPAGAGASPTEQLPKAILTLAVDQTEAQKVVYGSQHGQLYFGLLADESNVNESEAGTTARNLFD